jgi:hypothetical protein
MRISILALFGLFFSAQTFACPNLTGNYSCVDQDGEAHPFVVTQSVTGNVTVYQIDGKPMPADGVVYPIPDTDSMKSSTIRAWCNDDIALNVQVLGKIWQGNTYVADVTQNEVWTGTDSSLSITITGSTSGNGQTQPIDTQLSCTK